MAKTPRTLKRGAGVLGIATLALVALFALEAAPMRVASPEAEAWGFDYNTELGDALDNFNTGNTWGAPGGGSYEGDHNDHVGSSCTLNASVHATEGGVNVTLSWNTSPAATYVTINKFPSEEFEASGSKETFITETTKFIAYTHYSDSNDTASCYVTVKYTPPATDPCTNVHLSIDDNDFTWDGPPALSHYTAHYCDGTTSGKIDVHADDETTISLSKRIAKIDGKGGQCYLTATQNCPPPEPEPSCEDIELTIDNQSFTWDGPPKLEKYDVTYCDGTNTGWVNACVEDDATITLHKRIAKVVGKSEECRVEKTQGCPPPTPNPEWPECPFEDDADTTVIYFDGKGLRSDRSVADATSSEYPVSLPAGLYTIKSASWDGYATRIHAYQPYESWYLDLMADGKSIATTYQTTDLDDYVIESLKVDTIAYDLSIGTAIDTLVARHSAYPHEIPNSVQPICVAIDIEDHPPVDTDPVCTMGANPTTVYKGDSSTITWTSENATEATFEGITSTSLDGSAVVTPSVTTTYRGTFKDEDGETVTCSATVTVRELPEDDKPVCTMSVSDSRVSRNDTVTLSWTSENATEASINQGIGEVSLDGSTSVKITGDTTFTGTFEDDDGDTVTCSASVSIRSSGGGGRCLNCDDDEDEDEDDDRRDRDDEPTISLDKRQLVAGAAVSLSQIPYTGFSASPLITALFWIAVIALSVVIAYIVTVVRSRSMTLAVATEEAPVPVLPVATPVETPKRPPYTPVYAVPAPAKPTYTARTGDGDAQLIEDMAHKENILLSPEATRAIVEAVDASPESAPVFLGNLFKKAQVAYPREDGWILLSKERCASLLSTHQVTEEKPHQVRGHEFKVQTNNGLAYGMPVAPVASPVASAPAGAPASDVTAFIRLVAANEQQKAFELIRTITSNGTDLGVFIARVVRELDEVYKHRLEGNRNPDQALVALTATWSTQMFEAVLGSLVECIDYSYSSTRIGTKIALAKVFEQFAK